MVIKAVILDVTGTILTTQNTVIQGIPEMIARLKEKNIAIFTASNNFHDSFTVKDKIDIDKDNILFPDKIGGKKKGGKDFVEHICGRLNISRNELLYLGDSTNDCYEAVNSNVAFFLAGWSNPNLPYGILLDTPTRFAEIIETFFLKEALWYYQVNDKDNLGRSVKVRTLLDPDISRSAGITDFLKSKGLKGAKRIKGFETKFYLSMHLLASIYLEGLHLSYDGRKLTWCMYPGHDRQYAPTLQDFINMISKLFNERYSLDLVQRHAIAPRTSSARAAGRQTTMDTQLQTINLNPLMSEKVIDRSVIVVDDFTTQAHGFETTRNFLLNAKSKSVTCIAVGKYSREYIARSPNEGVTWDSFLPASLTEADFSSKFVRYTIDNRALDIF